MYKRANTSSSELVYTGELIQGWMRIFQPTGTTQWMKQVCE